MKENVKDFIRNTEDKNIPIKTQDDILETYSTDESLKDPHLPDGVAFPENTSQVSTIIKLAQKYKVPLTPRGRGTGLAGGAIPLFGGIVVSMEKMENLTDLDDRNMITETQPGIITGQMQDILKDNGLFYPVDPASLDSCSIGGNIATGAGGPRAVKYGTTDKYIRGLEIVLPNGEILLSGGKLNKNSTGYNIPGLFVRSEGTLGIITKIYLSILSYPRYVVNLLVPFNSVKEAVEGVIKIRKGGFNPSALELMEKSVIDIVSKHLGEGVPFSEAGAHLLIEFDGNNEKVLEETYMQVGEMLMDMGALDVFVADNDQSRDRMWKTRRSIHESVKLSAPIMEREDVVVPPAKLPDLMEEKNRLEEKHKIRILAFGHAGDGNVHINMIPIDDDVQYFEEHINNLLKDLFKFVISVGGQLSGEHGIGYFKKDYLEMGIGKEGVDLIKKLKTTIDPLNIMNPGKII